MNSRAPNTDTGMGMPVEQHAGSLSGASGVVGSLPKKARTGRDEIVKFLRERPGSLAADVAARVGISRNSAAKRLVQYVARGWVARGPMVPRDNSAGGPSEATTWYATDKLPPPINVRDIAKQRVVKNNAPNRDARIPKVIARLSDLEQAWLGAG